MIERTSMFRLLRSPAIARSLMSPRPTLVWTRDGSRILFGNAAALELLRIADQQALARRRYGKDHPLSREISRLALGRLGGAGLAKLRLLPAGGPAETADCERLAGPDGERLVVVTLHRCMARPTPEDAARALTGSGVSCALVEESGRIRTLAGHQRCTERARDLLVDTARNARRLGTYCHSLWGADQGPVGELVLADSERGSYLALLDDDQLLPGMCESIDEVRWAAGEPGSASRAWRWVAPAGSNSAAGARGGGAPDSRHGDDGAGAPVRDGSSSDSPVRFLWQTDDQNRFLFVSKGLEQVVGGGANVIGETWNAACDRLQLDPSGGISAAMSRHEEWGGLVAYWPTENADRRIPAELNASPIFGADRSFKGFRGFGVLRPADAAAIEPKGGGKPASAPERSSPPSGSGGPIGPQELPRNVVPLHGDEAGRPTGYRFGVPARGAPLALDAVAAAFHRWPIRVGSSEAYAGIVRHEPPQRLAVAREAFDGAAAAALQSEADLEALGERSFLEEDALPSAFALPRSSVKVAGRSAELEAARREAERASDEKSNFLARVSHEIRTPLNAIIGFAEVMIGERFGPLQNARYSDYLRDIRTSGEHVLSLINDLLDISKIEAGRLELDIEPIDLNAVVEDCSAIIQPQAGHGRVIVRTSLSPNLPPVRADRRTLQQIILNLLSNAVKFTGPGGQVILSSQFSREGEVMLRIRDTGRGMSEAELERALEPFRQLSTASLGSPAGSGLGLPLTKALIEANGAAFAISSSPGEGTIVRVTFAGAGPAAEPLPD